MICVCSQYKVHFDWPVVLKALFSCNAHRAIMGLQNQSKKPHKNKQLMIMKNDQFAVLTSLSLSQFCKISVWDFPITVIIILLK